jgi:pescadillo protein
MGKELKKGKKGYAKKYLTRTKAIKKLQLSLANFRRLCILKGIYPREPPKKISKKPTTFYLTKDIKFLQSDKILETFRKITTHMKKM